eukprot:CAMPEP_0197529024 /NCGR_PEP_ID=MMETSP1318-20131121/27056_1 /TAXON_ID=552666 /ORGANISM="Partenskyella glossopodia, Strain RCC365" /LENGTH=193 /DNA_ID=CAMNT_0043084343 /DNA_START=96 /DNA_END=677 /DNA_ORIENTATION=-
MKEAVESSHEGIRKNETTWPITKYHWLRNRYIYEAYYKKKIISRELYEFLVRNKVADGALIAKWKKPGFEFLCSTLAIDKSASNFGTTSICRVPLNKRSQEQQVLPAVNTGCVSCASCDKGAPIWWDGPFKRSDLMFSDEEEEEDEEEEDDSDSDDSDDAGEQKEQEKKQEEKKAEEDVDEKVAEPPAKKQKT